LIFDKCFPLIIGMTKSGAFECATRGMADLITDGYKEILVEMTKAAPIGRLGQSKEIADAVL
jgi:hypothetical protein